MHYSVLVCHIKCENSEPSFWVKQQQAEKPCFYSDYKIKGQNKKSRRKWLKSSPSPRFCSLLGTHQRRLSHDTSLPMKRSASGLRSRWTEREITEAYEIKVYEIDNVQRMHKRAGADKQVLGLFSFLLFSLEVNGNQCGRMDL
ncbi:hypothetical protein XENORESO_015009 [Xenotaenia resolanae]|uniref:Uncharacterized protein n=1 Tax=Xenotaenia resolanae TaxID=208358 RepID=A0ABV0X2S9_9TELE